MAPLVPNQRVISRSSCEAAKTPAAATSTSATSLLILMASVFIFFAAAVLLLEKVLQFWPRVFNFYFGLFLQCSTSFGRWSRWKRTNAGRAGTPFKVGSTQLFFLLIICFVQSSWNTSSHSFYFFLFCEPTLWTLIFLDLCLLCSSFSNQFSFKRQQKLLNCTLSRKCQGCTFLPFFLSVLFNFFFLPVYHCLLVLLTFQEYFCSVFLSFQKTTLNIESVVTVAVFFLLLLLLLRNRSARCEGLKLLFPSVPLLLLQEYCLSAVEVVAVVAVEVIKE